MFGTRRNPLSGSNSGHSGSDTRHERFYIECKQRLKPAVYTLYDTVKEQAQKENKIPLLVIDRVRSPGQLVVVHSDNLVEFCRAFLESL